MQCSSIRAPPPERPAPKTPARKSRPAEGTVSAAEVWQAEDRVFREVCQLVRDVQEKHPSVGYAVRLERSAPLEAAGYAGPVSLLLPGERYAGRPSWPEERALEVLRGGAE